MHIPEFSFDDETQGGSIPEGKRPHPDLVTHDEPPGFRTRISILFVFRLGEVESPGLAFVELSRSCWPKQTRAFELRYKREIWVVFREAHPHHVPPSRFRQSMHPRWPS
jgi:hypothetical protein